MRGLLTLTGILVLLSPNTGTGNALDSPPQAAIEEKIYQECIARLRARGISFITGEQAMACGQIAEELSSEQSPSEPDTQSLARSNSTPRPVVSRNGRGSSGSMENILVAVLVGLIFYTVIKGAPKLAHLVGFDKWTREDRVQLVAVGSALGGVYTAGSVPLYVTAVLLALAALLWPWQNYMKSNQRDERR